MLILLPANNNELPYKKRVGDKAKTVTHFILKSEINLNGLILQNYLQNGYLQSSQEIFIMYHISSNLNETKEKLLLPVIEKGTFFLWQRPNIFYNKYSYGFLDAVEDDNLLGLIKEFIKLHAEISINNRYYLINLNIIPPYLVDSSILNEFKRRAKERGLVHDVLAYPINRYMVTVK
jgi:hypothetical protein